MAAAVAQHDQQPFAPFSRRFATVEQLLAPVAQRVAPVEQLLTPVAQLFELVKQRRVAIVQQPGQIVLAAAEEVTPLKAA